LAATNVTPACNDDAVRLAWVMRADDRREMAALEQGPEEALFLCLAESSEAWTVWQGEEIMAMYGVRAQDGLVWMLSGESADRYPKAFYKASKVLLEDLRERHPRLWNLVDSRYDKAVRWLHRLGFRYQWQREINGVVFFYMKLGV
jgi:hypothetical protein